MVNEKIREILKSMKKGQPFTIEEILRKYGEYKGEEWSFYEIPASEELEKALNNEGLIREFGTTKLFIKN